MLVHSCDPLSSIRLSQAYDDEHSLLVGSCHTFSAGLVEFLTMGTYNYCLIILATLSLSVLFIFRCLLVHKNDALMLISDSRLTDV